MFNIRLQFVLALGLLACIASAATAQSGTIRGYPAGAALQQTPYYSTYYPVQYGYAYPPAANVAAAYQAAYPTIRLAPQTAYYAPAAANYAAARPTANYTLSPAGGASGGAEAYAYYGQSTPLNYVPPTYTGYQTRMVQVPVTYYRPYTVYQPGLAVPTTCQRATCGTITLPARHRWFSCLDWLFHHKRGCGAPAAVPVAQVPVAAVPAAVPRAVCYGSTCAPQCGTPYYNTVPQYNVVPGTVVPGTVVPGAVIPRTVVPGTTISPSTPGFLGPGTVPPPGTRTIVPGTIPGGTIPGGDGADIVPRINPGTPVQPPSSFPGTSGSGFSPSGANYSPRTNGGSGRSAAAASPYEGPALTRPTISEPSLGPRRSVQPVPDPAAGRAQEPSQPSNRAPALIAPGDRTAAARGANSGQDAWGVVPAKWPEKTRNLSVASERGSVQPVSQYVPAPREEVWDDTLWKSAK